MSKRALGVFVAALAAALFGSLDAAQALSPMEQLGKSIYFDARLSINQDEACAACHAPESGWTGPDATINDGGAVYEGSIPGRFGNRKPPSSAYATPSPIFHYSSQAGGMFVGGNFWDGRATGEKLGNPAADQAQGPFLNPLEQGLPDSACVVYLVCTGTYWESFEEVWGAGACAIDWPADVESACAPEGGPVILSDPDRIKSDQAFDEVALSIAAYEASSEVNAFSSKFDYARTGQARLSAEEQWGFALFQGKGKCTKCHVSNGQKPLFTDFTYDNLGVPKNPENPFYAELEWNPAGLYWVDVGLGGFLQGALYNASVYGPELGKSKVPTLRNVDKRPDPDFVKAFSHNGYFKSLERIVHFYNTRDVLPICDGEFTDTEAEAAGCWPAPEFAANMNTAELGNLGLTPDEEAAIVAFLRTLSDGYQP